MILMPSKHRITVNLSAEERDALASLSAKNRVSQAWIARIALAEFLERNKDDQMQLPFNLARTLQDDGEHELTEAAAGVLTWERSRS